MKNKILLSLFIYVICITITYANDLKISKGIVKPLDTLSLSYQFDNYQDLIDVNNLNLFIYVFTYKATSPTAYNIQLKYNINSKIGQALFVVPEDAVYAIIKIGDGYHFDLNHGNFWDFFVYNNFSVPVKGGYLRAGLSYLGNLPENCKRTVNIDKVLEYLSQESKLYPDNIQASIGYETLMLDMGKTNFDSYSNKIKSILKKNFNQDDENQVKAVIRALNTLKRTDDANEIQNSYLKKYPKSSFAEEIQLSNLSQTSSLDEFSQGVIKYLKDFPKSRNREKLVSALVSGYLQSSKYNELMDKLTIINKIPVNIYTQLASEVLSNDNILKDSTEEQRQNLALVFLNKAVEIDKASKENSHKPMYMSPLEWKITRNYSLASINEQIGEVFDQKSRYNDAFNYFITAKELYNNDVPSSLYENLVATSLNLKDTLSSYNYCVEAIENSKNSAIIEDRLDDVMDTAKLTIPYSEFLDSLKYIAREKRHKYLSLDKLEIIPSNVNIKTEFNTIDINSLKGKVIIIYFWSVWCGPCGKAFPTIEYINKVYKDNKNVEILPVNLWETSSDKEAAVEKYFTDNEIQLPKYYDEAGALPTAFGILGLPVTLILDKEGKIQFRIDGFSGDRIFLQNVIEKVDYLLNY